MQQSERIAQAGQPQVEPGLFIPPSLPPPPPLSGLDLPPPPEFSPGAFPSQLPVAGEQPFVDRIDEEQEKLRDSRDELLGCRFRLQAKRNELRSLREKTGATDGYAFNLLRRYLHESNIDIPHNIEKAFNEASLLRDRLGILETEYEDDETSYNKLEWNYTRKEYQFVEALVENDLGPNSTIKRAANEPNIADSNHQSGEFPNTWIGPVYYDGNGPGTDLQVLDEPIDHDLPPSNCAIPNLRRGASLRSSGSATRSTKRLSVNSPFPHPQSTWLAKVQRIDEWLLDMISNSPLQKAYLKSLHYLDYLDDDSWWEQLEQNWNLERSSDIREVPIFHTGDSTVSHRIASQRVSTSTADIVGSDDSVVEAGNSMPLLSEDRVLDVFDVTSRPSSIKAVDLSDSGAQEGPPTHGTIDMDETAVSDSTRQTPSRRTSSSAGNDTETTWDRLSGSIDCNRLPTQSPDQYREQPRLLQGSDLENQSDPATPTQRGQDEEASTMSCTISNSVDLQPSDSRIQTTTTAMSTMLELTEGLDSTSEKLTELHLPSTDLGSLRLNPVQMPLSLSPDLLPRPMSRASPESQHTPHPCPIATPIPASGARERTQFPFPLLPLTTTAPECCSHKEHHLKFRISLPGPTSDDSYF
ncbi:hypothetical protein N0V83_001969 [Neocucurbitaria cava]|uniref:Uncharacterized protein n=1 Tax=Neocucurbitaria cava TaxID=798079 RepID=A0A9W8YEE0_9PLEO|nr:hypothetical protein N0V83_001969 [Neocucurbitaria cava]